jgi:hypothetical protein
VSKCYYTNHFAPEASAIVNHVYYNQYTQELFVQIAPKNFIYGYKGVDAKTYMLFTKAKSAGEYYNKNIKGIFNPTLDGQISVEHVSLSPENPAPKYNFSLKGHSPVEFTVETDSVEKAKAEFHRLFPNGVLEEVKITFE